MEMEGLRNRFNEGKEKVRATIDRFQSTEAPPPPQLQTKERVFNLEQLKAAQEHVAPVFVAISKIVEVIEPVVDKIVDLVQIIWEKLEPYNPEDLFVAIYGLLLVFFGGIYMTLVASFEAAHQFGWDKIKLATRALYHEWSKARIAFERDDKVRLISSDLDWPGLLTIRLVHQLTKFFCCLL